MDDESANPYESPDNAGSVVIKQTAAKGSWGVLRFWAFTFLLNMLAPIVIGLSEGFIGNDLAEMWGMFLSIALIVVAGGIVIKKSLLVGEILACGSAIVALSQVFPVVHTVACIQALRAITLFGFDDHLSYGGPGKPLGLMDGMLAMLIAGTLIAIAGAAVGFLLYCVTPRRWWRDTPAIDSADI